MTDTTTRQDFGTCEELLSEVYPDLLRTALRKTGNEYDAQDLVQMAATRAFGSFARFQQGTNFRAWMFTIMSNLHLNNIRDAKKRLTTTFMGEDDDYYAVDHDADPQNIVDSIMDDRLVAALSTLSDEQRNLFIAVTVNEMTYKEASAHFGIAIGTVMSRLHRTKAKLATALAA